MSDSLHHFQFQIFLQDAAIKYFDVFDHNNDSGKFQRVLGVHMCYITVGMFARHGLGSKVMTLRSLGGVQGSEY